ncbi:MAG: GvpL/GvpF family gas vesicle protein [Vicinamibacterales bacterium]
MKALYVYAIVPPALPDRWSVEGVDSSPVRAISEANVVALVHDMAEPAAYTGSDEDVRRWVVEHASVVEAAWQDTGSALPVTFDVIVCGDDSATAEARLRAWLRDAADTLREQLRLFTARSELRIELGLRRSSNSSEHTPNPTLQSARGRDVLMAKRRLLVQREELREKAAALERRARRELASRCEQVVELPRVHMDDVVPVLGAAALVPNAGIEAVGRWLAHLSQEEPELVVRFLGPWPPYSFVSMPKPANPAAATSPAATRVTGP